MLGRSAKAWRAAARSQPSTRLARPSHLHSASAAPAHATTVFPASTSPSDSPLLQVFDAPDASAPSRSAALAPSGLFLQPALASPAAFPPLARQTTLRAQVIVARICRPRRAPIDVAEAEREFLGMVKALDRLSDLLCGVIDLAEVVRNVHPVAEWEEGANEAYEELCAFMNELNTHVGLYEVSSRHRADQGRSLGLTAGWRLRWGTTVASPNCNADPPPPPFVPSLLQR